MQTAQVLQGGEKKGPKSDESRMHFLGWRNRGEEALDRCERLDEAPEGLFVSSVEAPRTTKKHVSTFARFAASGSLAAGCSKARPSLCSRPVAPNADLIEPEPSSFS